MVSSLGARHLIVPVCSNTKACIARSMRRVYFWIARKLARIRSISVIVLVSFVCGCAGGSSTPSPTPPPTPTGFAITAVSPTTVDEGETLSITYTGSDPAQQGNAAVATFQQGTLTPQQGKLLGSDSLGNNSFRVSFQVPNGLASDSGVIPIPSTVTLSNSQFKSAPQNISIAPPPSVSTFPEEVYVGDTGDTLHVHGSNTHFDQSTTAAGSGGIQITGITVISSSDLIVTLSVASSNPSIATLSFISGATDPKTSETVTAHLAIAATASPVFGASQLSTTHGAPGAIVRINGLFNPEDSAHHNTIQWTISGQSFLIQPLSETASTLEAMVPLWPNPDGTVFTGTAQIEVNASGRSSQFDFGIDSLPSNPNPRGAVFSAILSSLTNSIPALQTKLVAVSSSSQAAAAFQSITTDTQSLVGQLQQFVNSEAGGTAAAPPGSTQTLSPQEFDLIEQLLLTSGLYNHAFEQMSLRTSLSKQAAVQGLTTEDGILAATAACELADYASKIITNLESVMLLAAVASAASSVVTGPAGIFVATTLVSAAATFDDLSDAVSVLSALCGVFPLSVVRVDFSPTPLVFPPVPGAPLAAETSTLTGTFAACSNPISPIVSLLEKLLEQKIKRLLGFLPIGDLLQQVEKKLVTFVANQLLSLAQEQLAPVLSKYLGSGVATDPIPITVSFTDLSTLLVSQNSSVAMSLGYSTLGTPGFLIQPMGPGHSNIFAALTPYKLMVNAATDCEDLFDATRIPGNALPVTVTGPPIVIPTNSGGSTGIIATTINGVPVDKAYVAVPGSANVTVINADASAGAPPIHSISMPFGFSPTATAANPTNLEVDVISYTSASVIRIDANTDTVKGMIPLPVTSSQNFSGGSCIVCGVVADPIADQFIFDTAAGYFIFDIRQNQIVQTLTDHPAENFGYDPLLREIVSPFYSPAFNPTSDGVDLISLPANSITAISALPSTIFKPDGATVDYTTHVAVVANEAESEAIGSLTFLNLGPASTATSGSTTIPLSTYTFPDASSTCSGGGNSSEWTMLAADPNTHLLFFANEFSNCAGVLDLPPIQSDGAPSAAATVRFGAMPTSPDGQPWENSHDPHGTAVFVSVVDGHSYGFLTRLDALYVARIDLVAVASATTLTGGALGQVDLTPYVVFLKTQ